MVAEFQALKGLATIARPPGEEEGESQKTPHRRPKRRHSSPLSEQSGEKEGVTIAGPPGEDQDEGQDLARPVWHASRSGEA